MIGRTLGHYRVVEQIGAGGMGVVYRAHDERLQRDVALKVLPPEAVATEEARKRFSREALALSRLNHPNVATVYDFDRQDGVDFIVMELIPGEALDETLRSGPLTEAEILRLGAQMAEGLAAAHREGVVHRDLKPANIRLTADGRLKLLDFGLAALHRPPVAESAASTTTQTQAIAGTVPYMAPEQLRGQTTDARTDIYAAGAVLYEMATGRRPFAESRGPQLIDAILNRQPPSAHSVNARLSPSFDSVIRKALEKDPARRYQSAKDLLADLERLAAGSSPIAARPRRAVTRLALPLAAVCLALVAAATLLRDRAREAGRIRSLAVLPLDNLSKDPDQEYFADGMTDALITDLAQIPDLRVISRTSILRYKGEKKKALPEIAKELGVEAVIEASVLRQGDRVRLTAQLIRAKDDAHLWAANYERDLRDVLALQAEVSRAIAGEVRARLTGTAAARQAAARAIDPAAHDAYLRGLYLCRSGMANVPKGIESLNRAIELDATYAPIYAALANCYQTQGYFGVVAPKDAYSRARAAAQKAIELDQTLADGYSELSTSQVHYDWDFAGAERSLRRALELRPGDANAHHRYAHYLLAMGRGDESVAETRKAAELDPLSAMLATCIGWHCLYSRLYDQAIESSARALELNPAMALANYYRGLAYQEKAMHKEATSEFEKTLKSPGPAAKLGRIALARSYALQGHRTEAEKALAELIDLSTRSYVSAYEIATVYVGLGDREQAFAWLEKAFQEHSSQLVHLGWDPRFDALRDDSRLADLLRRIGIPQRTQPAVKA
ncbi:MAG TPA: protein kinase [Vicinamibacteria bacterium]|nr:protein kinase [Vicinamibacteria bacterium]